MAEHRFFGKSKPFGEHSWEKGNAQFASIENTLMDYVNLV
jgi:hypothetical protein